MSVGSGVSVPVRAVSRPFPVSRMQQAKRFPTGGGSSPCPSSPSPSVSSPVVRARRPSSLPAGRGVRAVVSARPVRRSVVRRSSVSRPSPPVASSGRGVVALFVLLSRVPVAPPCRGVVRRVKRKGARGLFKVLLPSGSSVGAVGVGRRCRGRGSRSFLFPLSGAVGSRPSCRLVRPVRPVRPCPVVRGRGRAGVGRCRSGGGVGCSRVAPVRLSAVSRSVACPSVGVAGGGRACRLSAGSLSPVCPRPPLAGGSSSGCRSPCPPCGGVAVACFTLHVGYTQRHPKARTIMVDCK